MLEYGIYHKPNLRKTVEGILYRIRVGCPWRDLPKTFGRWNTVFQKFNRWSLKGKLMLIFKALVHEPDLEWEFIDGSIVKAHQHNTGAAFEENQAIGKSVGGDTTKIHMAVDAHGLPIDFEITGGEVHDCKIAPEFIKKLPNLILLLQIKGMIAKKYETLFAKNHLFLLFQGNPILKLAMQIWSGCCINIGI